jgi:hypothetical protein
MIPGLAAGVSPHIRLKYNAEVNKLDEELASASLGLVAITLPPVGPLSASCQLYGSYPESGFAEIETQSGAVPRKGSPTSHVRYANCGRVST